MGQLDPRRPVALVAPQETPIDQRLDRRGRHARLAQCDLLGDEVALRRIRQHQIVLDEDLHAGVHAVERPDVEVVEDRRLRVLEQLARDPILMQKTAFVVQLAAEHAEQRWIDGQVAGELAARRALRRDDLDDALRDVFRDEVTARRQDHAQPVGGAHRKQAEIVAADGGKHLAQLDELGKIVLTKTEQHVDGASGERVLQRFVRILVAPLLHVIGRESERESPQFLQKRPRRGDRFRRAPPDREHLLELIEDEQRRQQPMAVAPPQRVLAIEELPDRGVASRRRLDLVLGRVADDDRVNLFDEVGRTGEVEPDPDGEHVLRPRARKQAGLN